MAGSVYELRYHRVSRGGEEQESSLRAQRAETLAYGLTKQWLSGGAPCEDKQPGWVVERKGYQKLLVRARQLRAEGKRVAVVAVALDRLGRSVEEGARCRAELEALGVEVHFTRQGGVLQPLVADILQAVAAEETRRLGQRVEEQWKYHRGNGWAFIGRVPFGYRLRPSTAAEQADGATEKVLELDPERAPYAREAWERVAEGQSLRKVLDWFVGLPEHIRQGRCGNRVGFHRMLRSPIPIARDYPQTDGDLDKAGGALDDPDAILKQPVGKWPALIDDATWLKARRRMLRHRGPDGVPQQCKDAYLLVGWLRCATCGARMRAQVSSGSPDRPRGQRRYVCGGRDLGANAPDRTCRATCDMDAVDAAMRAELVALLEPLDTSDAVLIAEQDRQWETLCHPPQPPETARRIREAQSRLRRAAKELSEATRLLTKGKISQAAYDVTVPEIEAEREAAERELATAQAEAVKAPDLPALAVVRGLAADLRVLLERAEVPLLREGLARFITRVVAHRVARGKYRVKPVWSPLGDALRTLAELLAGGAPAAADLR